MLRTKEDIQRDLDWEKRQLNEASATLHRELQQARSVNTGSILSTNMARGMLEESAQRKYDAEERRLHARIAELMKERESAPAAVQASSAPVVVQRPIAVQHKQEPASRPATPKPQRVIPVGATAESLTKRGFIFLGDFEWEKANESFDNALDIDPEYAPAYIGLLCEELKITSEEELANQDKLLSDRPNFKKAVRFADESSRGKLEEYDNENQKNIIFRRLIIALEKRKIALIKRKKEQWHQEREQREKERRTKRTYDEIEKQNAEKQENNYIGLLRKKDFSRMAYEFEDLSKEFRTLNGYKDTVALADECDAKAKQIREALRCQYEQEKIKRKQDEKRREEQHGREQEDIRHRREQEEIRRKEEQSKRWEEQGLCEFCGGRLGFFRKCKSERCGMKN
jgi:hypothetical protein